MHDRRRLSFAIAKIGPPRTTVLCRPPWCYYRTDRVEILIYEIRLMVHYKIMRLSSYIITQYHFAMFTKLALLIISLAVMASAECDGTPTPFNDCINDRVCCRVVADPNSDDIPLNIGDNISNVGLCAAVDCYKITSLQQCDSSRQAACCDANSLSETAYLNCFNIGN
ncbi:hypothetical protein BDQ17DRAFT_1355956 [Cyathus striatus]|nr:hypothetical protein BDQ17DRAFT_1355956 [Cyathus striatus]